jgi:CubicO group peptidase (beta-lactamase class C family)
MKLFPRTNIFRRLLPAALALTLCGTPALAQDAPQYNATSRAARSAAWNAITKGEGSGVSIAIMNKGKLIFSDGMGVRERALNNPIDSHTRFNIGSVSKMFPAVATLLLVDDGKISLDDPVIKYVPDFKMKDDRYKDITVRMLVNHSSGLPGSSFVFSFAPEIDSHKLLLDTLARDHLKHAPGADSMYCNDGFTLAEILVERVSGQTFTEFLEKRVFAPLGMNDTGVSLGALPSQTKRAESYNKSTDLKNPAEAVEVLGAGGFSSTAEDLCRFGNSFTASGPHILSANSLKEIRTARQTPFGKQLRNRPLLTSLGWDYSHLSPYEADGVQILTKAGNTMFYSANLQVIPDQGLVIAMLISGNAISEELTRPILVELLDEAGVAQKEIPLVTRPSAQQTIPEELKRYEGYYLTQAPGAFKVSISEDKTHLNITPLKPEGDPQGEPAAPLFSLTYNDDLFIIPETGQTFYLTTIDGTHYIVATPHKGGPDAASVSTVDLVMLQQVKPEKSPFTLFQDQTKPWLVRNMPTMAIAEKPMVVTPATYAGLDGHVDFGGVKKVESPSYASIGATHLRDQTELEKWDDNGIEWVRTSDFFYSNRDPVASKAGENSVKIGAKGHNEWLELGEDAIVKVGLPKGGRVLVLGPDREQLFDSVFNSEELFAPKGSLVFCAGPVGSEFAVTLK